MGKNKKKTSTKSPPSALSPNEIVEKLQQTLQLHKAGQVEEAIQGYEAIIPLISVTSTLLSLHGNVGALYLSTGQYDLAKTHFEKSIELDPKNAPAHFNLAVLLTSKLNQHGAAVKHCALAMKYDPNNYKYYHLMGNIMQNLGKFEESEKYYLIADNLANNLSSTSATATSSSESNVPIVRQLLNHLSFHVHGSQEHSITLQDRNYLVKIESVSPVIITIEDFLTADECDYIRNQSKDRLEKSFVMGNSVKLTDEYVESQLTAVGDSRTVASTDEVSSEEDLYRSSYNTWLPLDEHLISLQERIANLLNLPTAYIKFNSEDLQVVKYEVNGQFKLHQDSSGFHSRLMTVLFYLNDINSIDESFGSERVVGGETWFPFTNPAECEEKGWTVNKTETAILQGLNIYDDFLISSKETSNYSHEALPGTKVSPKKGKVVIFLNYQAENDELSPVAVHAGLPIRRLVNGIIQSKAEKDQEDNNIEKWVANYWIKFNKPELQQLFS